MFLMGVNHCFNCFKEFKKKKKQEEVYKSKFNDAHKVRCVLTYSVL